MAAGDYRFCDVCDTKAFYDANLGYNTDAEEDIPPARIAGVEQPSGNRLWRIGDWAVICVNCAKTHKTAIVKIDAAPTPTEEPQP